jgi:hypothetical protein
VKWPRDVRFDPTNATYASRILDKRTRPILQATRLRSFLQLKSGMSKRNRQRLKARLATAPIKQLKSKRLTHHAIQTTPKQLWDTRCNALALILPNAIRCIAGREAFYGSPLLARCLCGHRLAFGHLHAVAHVLAAWMTTSLVSEHRTPRLRKIAQHSSEKPSEINGPSTDLRKIAQFKLLPSRFVLKLSCRRDIRLSFSLLSPLLLGLALAPLAIALVLLVHWLLR